MDRRASLGPHPDNCSHPNTYLVGYFLPSGDTFEATVCRVCNLMFNVQRARVPR